MFSPGNLRATFDNPNYERLISHYIGEKYTLRYTGGMVPDVFQVIELPRYDSGHCWTSLSPYACFCLSIALRQQSHLAHTSQRHQSTGICLDLPLPLQIIVKEKGVFTNVISPSTKAKLRILFEVAPLSLLVSPGTHLSHERPLLSLAEASPPLDYGGCYQAALGAFSFPNHPLLWYWMAANHQQGCFMDPGTSR